MKLPVNLPLAITPKEIKKKAWFQRLPKEGKDEFSKLQTRLAYLERAIAAHGRQNRATPTRILVTSDEFSRNPYPEDGDSLAIEAHFLTDQSAIFVYPNSGLERDEYVRIDFARPSDNESELQIRMAGRVSVRIQGEGQLAMRPVCSNAIKVNNIPHFSSLTDNDY